MTSLKSDRRCGVYTDRRGGWFRTTCREIGIALNPPLAVLYYQLGYDVIP